MKPTECLHYSIVTKATSLEEEVERRLDDYADGEYDWWSKKWMKETLILLQGFEIACKKEGISLLDVAIFLLQLFWMDAQEEFIGDGLDIGE